MFGKKPEALKSPTKEELLQQIRQVESGKPLVIPDDGSLTDDNLTWISDQIGDRFNIMFERKQRSSTLMCLKTRIRNQQTQPNTPTQRRSHKEDMDLLISEESSLTPDTSKPRKPKQKPKKWGIF